MLHSASKCTESRVKIRSKERAVKNTEVTSSESDGPCFY